MTERVFTLREINRATLARQLLLERAAISAPAAIERLVGMQAQLAVAPYVGLWTRLTGFRRDDLARLIEGHSVVKATLIRATLHLARRGLSVAADDAPARDDLRRRGDREATRDRRSRRSRADHDGEGIHRQEAAHVRGDQRNARRADAGPRNRRAALHRADASAVGAGADHQRVELSRQTRVRAGGVVARPADRGGGESAGARLRYLAAFGPATVQDLQTWSGLQKLKDAIAEMKTSLRIYRDERGRELLDLPDMPLPEPTRPRRCASSRNTTICCSRTRTAPV